MIRPRQLARARRRARMLLLCQALWSAFWPGQALVGLFLLLALADILPALGGWGHGAALLLLAALLVWVLLRARRRFRAPPPEAADRQIERASGLGHRPLASLADRPATPDPVSAALWRAHLERIGAGLDRLRAGWPRSAMPARDPRALRLLLLVALAVAFGLAGGDSGERLGRAFAPAFATESAAPVTVELWIEPPAYTGLPALFAPEPGAPLEAPVGSVAHVRVAGLAGAALLRVGPEEVALQAAGGVAEGEAPLLEGPRIAVSVEDRELAGWPVTVAPDAPPTARFDGLPQATSRHALRIDYAAGDDHGVTALRAEATPPEEAGTAPLLLPLPVLGEARAPGGSAYFDLTAHLWAGRPVAMRVVAVDGAGQEGASPLSVVVLPEREFTHPVAQKIVKLRKTLLPGIDRPVAATVFARLKRIAADTEAYDGDLTVALALSVAAGRLRAAGPTGEAVASTRKLLWETALRLEDNDLSLAYRELRATREALMRALEENRDDTEIGRLIDELRRALDRLLSEMAKNAPRNAEMAPMQPGEGRTVDRDELQSMVERLRELWEAGAREAAMDLLAELQNMLENMRMAEMSEGQASRNAQTMRMLQELQRLARDQHRLLDRTFREGNQAPYGAQQAPQNDGPPGGRSGRQAGAGRSWEGMSDLRAAQQRLRRRLGEFGRRLGERFGSVPGAFGKAGMSMRDAAGLLGAGEREPAMEAQGRALEELRQAGAELMRNLAREGGRRAGPGSRDPLGRSDGGLLPDRSDVGLPDKGDLQRARRIRDELRRRVGEEARPVPERDYLERLLRRF